MNILYFCSRKIDSRCSIDNLRLVVFFALIIAFSSCQKDEAQKMFDSGMVLWNEQKYDESIQNFVALTKAFPNHHLVDDSLFWTANIYEHYLKDADQSVRFYRSLTNKFENSEYHTRSMASLARVRAQQGNEGKRKAIRILMKLQKQEPSHTNADSWEQNQLQLAQLFFELQNYEQGRIELKRLIYELPKSNNLPFAYYKIGNSYREEDNLELAKLTFQETDKRFNYKKKSLSSALSLADIYEETGQLNEAIQVYQSVLNRLEQKEVVYQLANNRIQKLKLRVKKTKTG